MQTITLKRYTDQLRNTRKPKLRTCKLWEETSMPNWDQGMELSVSVLDRALLTRETREVTG